MPQNIRQEFNIVNTALTAASGVSATSNEIVQLDTTKFSGSPTYNFEVVASSSSASFVASLRRKGTTTDDATVTVNTTGSSRFRASFTPPAGATEYVVFISTAAVTTKTITLARIIILQSETAISGTETQIEISPAGPAVTTSTTAAFIGAKNWQYNAANWDGTTTFSAEAVYKTAGSNTNTITFQQDDGVYGTWTDLVTVVNAVSNTAATRARVAFTPTDGRHYRFSQKSSTTKSNVTFIAGHVVIDQSGTITKSELQMVVVPTFLSALGGLNGGQFVTIWNSNEWDAGTGSITYKHAIDDAQSGSTACTYKITDTTASADIVNSAISVAGSTTHQFLSSALGAFTSGNTLSINDGGTGNNAINCSKIIVFYVFGAPPPPALPEFVQQPLQPQY